MLGWFSDEIARASRSKRALNCSRVVFMATARPNRVSTARKTSPMPPSPSLLSIRLFGYTLGATIGELAEVVALAETGRIRLRTERFALDQAAEVYARLEANQLQTRAVLVPNG